MDRRRRQRGVLLVAAIILLVVVSALVATMAFVTATSGGSATDNLQSGQGLFLAESGLELETRSMAQNLEWYRSTTDPLGVTTQNFGQGSFTVQANLPATMLRMHANSGDASITVYTTNRFPNFNAVPSPPTTCNPCYLQLDDVIGGGAEYVRYTGIAGNTFTGLTRNVTIGIQTGTAGAHDRSATVYPVTTLSVGLPASCAAPANVQIVAHSKFLSAGTLDIEGEEISYRNSNNAGGVTTLTGITRCLDDVTGPPGNTPASHAVLAPVTPVLIGDFSKDYEAQVVSTGTVGNTQRTMNRVLQR